jgi:hypothetical protein
MQVANLLKSSYIGDVGCQVEECCVEQRDILVQEISTNDMALE